MKKLNIAKLGNRKMRKFSHRVHPIVIRFLKIFEKLSTIIVLDLEKGINLSRVNKILPYEEYKKIQIFGSEVKFNDRSVKKHELKLKTLVDFLSTEIQGRSKFLCHGVRNGNEITAFYNLLKTKKIYFLGTDINPSTGQLLNCITHDFQEPMSKKFGKFNIIYTNSLDQCQDPQKAITSMFQNLYKKGILILEFSEYHGKMGFSKLDPFTCEIEFFPYVYLNWFDNEVKLQFLKDKSHTRRGWYIIRK